MRLPRTTAGGLYQPARRNAITVWRRSSICRVSRHPASRCSRTPNRLLILPKRARRIGTDTSATSCHFEDRACAELSEVQRCRPRSGARDPQSAGRAVSCGLPLVVPPPRRMESRVNRDWFRTFLTTNRHAAWELPPRVGSRHQARPWPWSFHLLQHANLLLIRVPVVAPDHIRPRRVAPNFLHNADPDGPVPAGPCARAANGCLLSRQSDRITGLQCHRLEQPA
jgi:hypothetical protein